MTSPTKSSTGWTGGGGWRGVGMTWRIEEGPTAAAQSTDWASDHLPDDVLETDQAIARLPPRYQEAVRIHYMTGRNWPTSAKAKHIHTSRATFFLRLNAAKVGIYMTLISRI